MPDGFREESFRTDSNALRVLNELCVEPEIVDELESALAAGAQRRAS